MQVFTGTLCELEANEKDSVRAKKRRVTVKATKGREEGEEKGESKQEVVNESVYNPSRGLRISLETTASFKNYSYISILPDEWKTSAGTANSSLFIRRERIIAHPWPNAAGMQLIGDCFSRKSCAGRPTKASEGEKTSNSRLLQSAFLFDPILVVSSLSSIVYFETIPLNLEVPILYF